MRTKKGIVTSAKMINTVTVTVGRFVMHPKYQKRYSVSTKFLVDTNGLTARVGDVVLIGETRPLSKRKYFKLLEILESAPVVAASIDDQVGDTKQLSRAS